MLSDLLPKEATCKVRITGGEEIEISFRPFTLRDLAWMQDEFDTDQKRRDVAKLKAEALCKIIWYMMKAESKALFREIKFVKYDDENDTSEEIKIKGYEKLLHLLASQEDMIEAFSVYSQMESLNNFMPDFAKKKAKT
jgi:hypothetical protein